MNSPMGIVGRIQLTKVKLRRQICPSRVSHHSFGPETGKESSTQVLTSPTWLSYSTWAQHTNTNQYRTDRWTNTGHTHTQQWENFLKLIQSLQSTAI